MPRKKNLKSSINNILIDFAPRAHRDDIVDTRRKIMQLFSLYKSRKYEEFEKLSQKYQRNAERSKNRPKKTVSSTVNRSAHQRQSDRVHKEVLRLLDTKEFCSAPPAQSKRCSKQTERFEDSLFGRSTLPAKNDASNGIEVISDDDDYSNDDDSDYDNSSDDDVPLSMRVPEKNGKSSGKTPDSRRQSQNSEKGNYLDDIETYLRIKRSHKIQQLVRKDEWKVASGEGSSSLRMLRKRANNEQSPGSSQSSDLSQISYKSKVQNGRKLLDNMEFYSPPKKQRTLAKSPGGARTCVWIASSSDDELDKSKSNSNGKKVAGGSNSERNHEHALQESARSMEISDSSSYDECSLVERMKQTSTTKTKLPLVEETQQPVFIDMTMMISSDEEDPNEMNLGPAIESNSDPDDGSQTIRSPQYIPEEERNENKEPEEIRVTSSTDVLAKEIIPDLGDFEEVLAFSNIEMEQLPVTSNMEKIPGLDDFEEVLDRFHTDKWNEVNEADEAPQKNNETEMIADWCDIYTTPEVCVMHREEYMRNIND